MSEMCSLCGLFLVQHDRLPQRGLRVQARLQDMQGNVERNTHTHTHQGCYSGIVNFGVTSPYSTARFLAPAEPSHCQEARVGQNRVYTVCIWYFLQGNHQVYFLANPAHMPLSDAAFNSLPGQCSRLFKPEHFNRTSGNQSEPVHSHTNTNTLTHTSCSR
jgi:hypothetical protein